MQSNMLQIETVRIKHTVYDKVYCRYLDNSMCGINMATYQDTVLLREFIGDLLISCNFFLFTLSIFMDIYHNKIS